MAQPLPPAPDPASPPRRARGIGVRGALLGAVVVLALSSGEAARAQPINAGPEACVNAVEFLQTRALVERSGFTNADKSRLVRTLRLARTLAEEGCPARDPWLIRRSIGMLNSVNREIGRRPVGLPMFMRD